jgi:predicted transglutaminase-like cysteine proteinase
MLRNGRKWVAGAAMLLAAGVSPALAQPTLDDIISTPAPPIESAPPELPDPMADLIGTVLDPFYVEPKPLAPNIFGSFALLSSSESADSQARRLEVIAWPPTDGPWNALVVRLRDMPRRDQLIAVNTWVNRKLAVGHDYEIYGKADHWASIEEAFSRRRGDCEDFAIAKMQLLEAAGISRSDLYLAVLKDEVRGVDHAVLAVRDGDNFWILDSVVDQLRRSEQVFGYRPVMTFSAGHAWVHGYRRGSAMAR